LPDAPPTPVTETRKAIAWSPAATVGDIAVAGSLLTGELAAGLVDCRLSAAGKFRNGAARSWCVSHQTYWGVNADIARADGRCRAAHLPLAMVLDPLTIHIEQAGALSLAADGGIHVGLLDVSVPALALLTPGLFDHAAITRLHVTPPALAAMAQADGCVDCARCGHPHLDLGSFAVRAHRRHTCGHCGHDSTHSGAAIVSNPLYLLRQRIEFKR
jgi:hypothetical protein